MGILSKYLKPKAGAIPNVATPEPLVSTPVGTRFDGSPIFRERTPEVAKEFTQIAETQLESLASLPTRKLADIPAFSKAFTPREPTPEQLAETKRASDERKKFSGEIKQGDKPGLLAFFQRKFLPHRAEVASGITAPKNVLQELQKSVDTKKLGKIGTPENEAELTRLFGEDKTGDLKEIKKNVIQSIWNINRAQEQGIATEEAESDIDNLVSLVRESEQSEEAIRIMLKGTKLAPMADQLIGRARFDDRIAGEIDRIKQTQSRSTSPIPGAGVVGGLVDLQTKAKGTAIGKGVSSVLSKYDRRAIEFVNTERGNKIIEGISDMTGNSLLKLSAGIDAAFTDKTYDDALKLYLKNRNDENHPQWKKFIFGLQDSAPQTLVGVALNAIPVVGKAASTAYWTALSASEQIKENGKITSLGNVAIDVVGDRMLGSSLESLMKKGGKSFVGAFIKNGTVEGGTEVAQTLLKMGNDYRKSTTNAEKQAILDKAKNYFQSGDVLQEFGIGAVAGGGVTAIFGGGAGQQLDKAPGGLTASDIFKLPSGTAGRVGDAVSKIKDAIPSRKAADVFTRQAEEQVQDPVLEDTAVEEELDIKEKPLTESRERDSVEVELRSKYKNVIDPDGVDAKGESTYNENVDDILTDPRYTEEQKDSKIKNLYRDRRTGMLSQNYYEEVAKSIIGSEAVEATGKPSRVFGIDMSNVTARNESFEMIEKVKEDSKYSEEEKAEIIKKLKESGGYGGMNETFAEIKSKLALKDIDNRIELIRFGGDEFVIDMNKIPLAEEAEVARKIGESVKKWNDSQESFTGKVKNQDDIRNDFKNTIRVEYTDQGAEKSLDILDKENKAYFKYEGGQKDVTTKEDGVPTTEEKVERKSKGDVARRDKQTDRPTGRVADGDIGVAGADSLEAEARKYKSADEFLNSITTGIVDGFSSINTTKHGKNILLRSFHGTKEKFEDFKITEKGVRYSGDGVYFTPSNDVAKGFAGDNGRVIESFLDLKKPYVSYLPEDNIDFQYGGDFIKTIKRDGFDSLIVRIKDTDTVTKKVVDDTINEIVVFDTDAIKTKPQLTDIWNKAQKTEKKPTAKKAEPKKKPVKKTADNGETLSTHYQRIKDEFGFTGDEPTFERKNEASQKKQAFAYIQKNPKNALKIGYGFEEVPSGIDPHVFRAALVATLRADGKMDLARSVAKVQSLHLTESAQSLAFAGVDIKGGEGMTKIERDITRGRLERIGQKISQDAPVEEAKKLVKKETKKLSEKVTEKQDKIDKDLGKIDDFVNNLIC